MFSRRRQAKQLCEHCGKRLSPKAYNEHKRLYYHEGTWVGLNVRSRSSSPINLSSDSCPESPLSNDQSYDTSSDSEIEDERSFDETTHSELYRPTSEETQEHWFEDDNEIDLESFNEPSLESCVDDVGNDNCPEDAECKAIVWWLVAFTCVFQTFHSLSLRAIHWLLLFLAALLSVLGKFSSKVEKIAQSFPSTLYLRDQYLKNLLLLPAITYFVVCPTCHSLYQYSDCLKSVGTQSIIQCCSRCLKERNSYPLLKRILTCHKHEKFYPYRVYPYTSLISALQSLLLRPDFLEECMQWTQDDATMSDVFDGQIWKEYFVSENSPFYGDRYSLGVTINIDWFQPYKHQVYSVGVIYLAIMNLPRNLRFKRENIVIIGLIPGPSEPSRDINTYLSPLVSDLLQLWHGVKFSTYNAGIRVIRCALLNVACDLPAGRKVCGFLSVAANLGCSRCYRNFGTSTFHAKQNYSGFDRQSWNFRSNSQHRSDVQTTLECTNKSERKKTESRLGCRYSCLIELPYFDPVRMLTVDPMHNMYLGTAKRIMQKVWLERGIINSSAIAEINKRISCINVPPNVSFSRLPPSIQSCSGFTAEQWMLWTNYYSMFCLYEVIPLEHLRCWQYFVLASRVLSRRPISDDDVSLGDGLLLQFCRRFESLYGEECVTPNMHMHCHLAECIKDYGPLASFWLYSFERYNGILGDQHTNNQSIELQLMKRFMEDNAHIQLLSTQPQCTSDVDKELSHAVVNQVMRRNASKHADEMSCIALLSTSGVQYIPAKKYTLSVFPEFLLDSVKDICIRLYPQLTTNGENEFQFPSTYKNMSSITFRGQEYRTGQLVHAKSVFPFASSNTSSLPTSFFDPTLRPAYIHHFAVYTFQHADMFITHPFAYVKWFACHPLQDAIGKPCQIWCRSVFENHPKNSIVPLENIRSILLAAEYMFEDENVVVITPL